MVKYVHRLPTIWFDTALARSVASPSEKGQLNNIYVNIGSNIFHVKVFVCQNYTEQCDIYWIQNLKAATVFANSKQ